jgi:hypothetical protein
MEEEKTICELHPSQILNLKAFTLSILTVIALAVGAVLTNTYLSLTLAILPLGYALWKWLDIKTTTVKITDQRIIIKEQTRLSCTACAIPPSRSHFFTACSAAGIS